MVQDLHAYYGETHVLRGVSMELRKGEVLALLGRNGVGKTTLVRSVAGLMPQRRGAVYVKGQNVIAWHPHRIARWGVAVVPQGRWVFPSLTVEENLRVVASRRGPWTPERIYELFPRLRERRGHLGRHLSGGEQQMLAIARALVMNPDLLIMDEPSEGLAPILVRSLRDTLLRLRDAGLSVLLVEQNLSLALAVADRVLVMSRGAIQFEGTPAELESNLEIMSRYLGI